VEEEEGGGRRRNKDIERASSRVGKGEGKREKTRDTDITRRKKWKENKKVKGEKREEIERSKEEKGG
jgi:hypothetical protein